MWAMACRTRRGRAFQQIGEPHQQLAFAHPDGVLDAGESEEFDFQFGDGRVGAKFAVGFLKDLEKILASRCGRLAWELLIRLSS